jgi:hypothetical protein
MVNDVLVPIVRAGIELARHRPEKALDERRRVAPYELGFIAALAPLHLRAQSYLMQGAGAEAVQEFQRLRDHRGSDPFSPFHAVSMLGIARAQVVAGNVAAGRNAYEQFLASWGQADTDVPVLVEARNECSRLGARAIHSSPEGSPTSGSRTRSRASRTAKGH